ncbi:ABC transporter related [Halanaerobium saccharolyticum subsp. saccharolyticum DSM 6643]|uniref:ABC transporter related n=1 Tax=Halanaerobium saccharolyticum subsp. saccharolyticum DSM 6643 TaxID=1293054 RepID=M5E1T4_9FIRM|nr:ATP-binding cassette domain-containing protein [Halanaerobium saccharolyticum]CCU79910.1 ABC transporter related [Halanaerobium saccharolyticum subsp. saccharolyticum DSM 6643]
MKNSNSLEIKNLSSQINGQQILNNFNLKIKKDSIHSVLFKNKQSKNELLKFLTAKKDFENAELIIEGANISREQLQNLNQNKIYLIDQYSAVNPEKDPLGVFQFNKKGNTEKKSTVFPEMTVAENIFFGREPLKSFLFFKSIDNQKMVELTEELISLLTIDLSPDQKMVELSPLEKQLVAVLKALSCRVEILIIDQAVVNLASDKKKIFFNFLKKLKAKGITIVNFTSEIKEVFISSDYVSVLKDGQSKGEYKVSQLEYNELALLLMGE